MAIHSCVCDNYANGSFAQVDSDCTFNDCLRSSVRFKGSTEFLRLCQKFGLKQTFARADKTRWNKLIQKNDFAYRGRTHSPDVPESNPLQGLGWGVINRHLYERIIEHELQMFDWQIYMKQHGVAKSTIADKFSVLRRCRTKLDCPIYEMLFTQDFKTIIERAVGLHSSEATMSYHAYRNAT